MEEFTVTCIKCRNKSICEKPCYFVETFLAQVTKGIDKQTGKNELTYFGNSYWEKRFSEFHPATLKKVVFEVADESEPDLSPDQRFDDLEYTPQQKIAGVFYSRFFLGKSYQEIGEKYGIDHRHAASIYGQAKKRVLEIVKILDGRDRAVKWCHDLARNRFSKHEKAFLLNKVFGYSFKEIADILGYTGPDAIQHKVNGMANEVRKCLQARG
jgi:hypothetical protein